MAECRILRQFLFLALTVLSLCASVIDATAQDRGKAEARTIVSLAPSHTELTYALGMGELLVGRSSACDYPAACKALPVAGDFGRPNLERLLELRPDIVLITQLEKPDLIARIKQMGIQPLVLPCEGWSDLMHAAAAISEAVGEAERGRAWIQSMEARRAALVQRVEQYYADRSRPRIYVEVWGDPLTTMGPATFLDDMVRLAGGANIGSTLKKGYVHVSAEWVIRENPDVIVLAYRPGPVSSSGSSVEQRPGWSSIRAIREGRICRDISPDLLLRPGPRMIEGAEALAEWLMAMEEKYEM